MVVVNSADAALGLVSDKFEKKCGLGVPIKQAMRMAGNIRSEKKRRELRIRPADVSALARMDKGVSMDLVTGFELALLVVALGAGGLTAFALYLRNRYEGTSDITSLSLDADAALWETISAIAVKLHVTDQQAVHFAINRLHAELLPSSGVSPSK